MDCALADSLDDTLDGLFDVSNRAQVLSLIPHAANLDLLQGDPHLVDKIQVNVIVSSVMKVVGAADGEGDLRTNKRKVCPTSDLGLVCVDGHFDLKSEWFFFGIHKACNREQRSEDLLLVTPELLLQPDLFCCHQNWMCYKGLLSLVQWKLGLLELDDAPR